MPGHLTTTYRELDRLQVLERVSEKRLTQREAPAARGLSTVVGRAPRPTSSMRGCEARRANCNGAARPNSELAMTHTMRIRLSTRLHNLREPLLLASNHVRLLSAVLLGVAVACDS